MTKRGEEITVTCAWCQEAFTYTFDRGRIRRFHPEDHRDAEGNLTRCHWHYSNNDQRIARARRFQAEEASRIQAQVEARLDKAIRAQVQMSMTKEERTELLRSIRETRKALTLLLGRTHEKASAPVTLGHYRNEVKDRLIPLLEEIEAVLRR